MRLLNNTLDAKKTLFKLSAAAIAVQLCFVAPSAWAQSTPTTPDTSTQTVDISMQNVKNTAGSNYEIEFASGAWQTAIKSGAQKIMTLEDVKKEQDWGTSDPNKWSFINLSGSTPINVKSDTDAFDKFRHHTPGTYSIMLDSSDSPATATLKYDPRSPVVDSRYHLNTCLAYSPKVKITRDKDGKISPWGMSDVKIAFTNICKDPVSLSKLLISSGSNNPGSGADLVMNNSHPRESVSGLPDSAARKDPQQFDQTKISVASDAYPVTTPQEISNVVTITDANAAIAPGKSMSFAARIEHSETTNEILEKFIGSEHAGNMHVFTNIKPDDAEKTPASFYLQYPDGFSDAPINSEYSASLLSTSGGAKQEIPLILGATQQDPEILPTSLMNSGSVNISIPAIQVGANTYLWPIDTNGSHVQSNTIKSGSKAPQQITLGEVEANQTLTINTTGIQTPTKTGDLSGYVAVSNNDQKSSQILSESSYKNLKISNLLPESVTVKPSTVYYNDSKQGKFYTYTADKTSYNNDLSSASDSQVLNIHYKSETMQSSDQYKIDETQLPADLTVKKMEQPKNHIKLMLSDTTNPEVPAINMSLQDAQKFYLRQGHAYNATLIQGSVDESIPDPDNDKVLEIDGKLYQGTAKVNPDSHTVSISLKPYAPKFMPYFDVSKDNHVAQDGPQQANAGITVAFITDDTGSDCDPTIANQPLDQYVTAVNAYANTGPGHDYYVSFGGENGSMLAVDCPVDKLINVYNDVYNKFNVDSGGHFKGFDFDIEGSAISDDNLNAVLPTALKSFHESHPDAEIWLTLATMPSGQVFGGIPLAGSTLIENIANKGTGLTGYNLMTMDYGDKLKFPEQVMGKDAITAGTSLATDLMAKVYKRTGYSNLKLQTMISNTPMIGVNDTGSVFNIEDANQLETAAKQYGWGVRFWSANRDIKLCSSSDLSNCAGTTGETGESSPGQFTDILSNIAGPSPQPSSTFELSANPDAATEDVMRHKGITLTETGYKSGDACHTPGVFSEKSAGTTVNNLFTVKMISANLEANTGDSCTYNILANDNLKTLAQDMPVTVTDDDPSGSYSSASASFTVTKAVSPVGNKKITAAPSQISIKPGASADLTVTESGNTDSKCDRLKVVAESQLVNALEKGEPSYENGICTYKYDINATDTAGQDTLELTDNDDPTVTPAFVGVTVSQAPVTKAIIAPHMPTSIEVGKSSDNFTVVETGYSAGETCSMLKFRSNNSLIFKQTSSSPSSDDDGTCVFAYTMNAPKDASTGNATVTISDSTDPSVSLQKNVTVNGSGPTPSGTCPQYVEGDASYTGGTCVTHLNKQYICTIGVTSGWCHGAAWAYAPGTGTAWQQAWHLKAS